MDIDLDLYRHELRVSTSPLVRLSAIDISPDHPQRTFVFIHGFGGQTSQWQYQLQKFVGKYQKRISFYESFLNHINRLLGYPIL